MATTVTATTLTSTITESISLNGNTYGNTISHSVATVGECLSSTMSVALTEVTVLTLGTVDAGGTVVGDNVKYMRFTNLDDTNFITLSFKASAEHFSVKLNAGESYVCMNNQMNAEADAGIGTLQDFTSVTAKADTVICDMEYIVVSS